MGYFLRQDKKKNGIYLQMYETYWNPEIKQARTRCVKSFGYVDELKSSEIPDPVSHFKALVRKEEEERRAKFNDEMRPRAFGEPIEKNIGHFMLAAMMKTLEVKETIDLLASVRQFQFSVYDMLAQLIYSRVIEPCSKSKAVSHVFPILYDYAPMSEDQVYAGEELGHCAKYINIESTDKCGKKIKPLVRINQAKIDEDMRFAGYNLIVSSEINMSPEEIYRTYHSLWKIEESFRITKSYLDARPVFVQTRETIYGHFLVCYLALFLLRVLEIKCFGNIVNAYDLIAFIRDFRVVRQSDNTFINISRNRYVNVIIKKATGLANLDALYLSKSEIVDFFRFPLLL